MRGKAKGEPWRHQGGMMAATTHGQVGGVASLLQAHCRTHGQDLCYERRRAATTTQRKQTLKKTAFKKKVVFEHCIFLRDCVSVVATEY